MYSDKKHISGFLEPGVGDQGETDWKRNTWEPLWVMEVFFILVVVYVSVNICQNSSHFTLKLRNSLPKPMASSSLKVTTVSWERERVKRGGRRVTVARKQRHKIVQIHV